MSLSLHSDRKKRVERTRMYYSRSNAKILEDDTISSESEKQQILDRYSVDLRFADPLYN